MAHSKYKNSLHQLIKIGKGDQLAASHRYILQWVRSLEVAISEQQKIFMQRANLDTNKLGYYLISLPSEKIATMCVMHLMKVLLNKFTTGDTENQAAVTA